MVLLMGVKLWPGADSLLGTEWGLPSPPSPGTWGRRLAVPMEQEGGRSLGILKEE